MRTTLTITLVLIFHTCFAQIDSPRIDWETDIDFLKKELPVKHKDFFTIRSKEEFEEELNKIITKLEYLDNDEVVFSLQQILASFGDSHTYIGFSKLFSSEKSLPISVYWFENGFYILETTKNNKFVLGSRIKRINDFPLNQICDSLKTMFTVDNEAMVKLFTAEIIKNKALLKYFGFAKKNAFQFEIEKTNGNIVSYQLDLNTMNKTNKIVVEYDSLAYCWRNKNDFFNQKYFANDSIYYVQYNVCSGKEVLLRKGQKQRAENSPSFNDFEDTIFKTIKTKPIKKFIFDMRFNGGGSSLQGTAFIEKLSKIEKINEKDRLYVVVGRNTFSSAILNTLDFKKMTEAIILGEETSGKPNHFGETIAIRLPESKIHLNYSTKYFKNVEENVNTIVPDVIIQTSYEDYINGIDPIYEWVKNN